MPSTAPLPAACGGPSRLPADLEGPSGVGGGGGGGPPPPPPPTLGHRDLATGEWRARNFELLGLDQAELGARLFVTSTRARLSRNRR
jgi:hypothetical protein